MNMELNQYQVEVLVRLTKAIPFREEWIGRSVCTFGQALSIIFEEAEAREEKENKKGMNAIKR